MSLLNPRPLSTLNCRLDTGSLISSWVERNDGMKLRIMIEGPKVHDVGYRYFLMTLARRAPGLDISMRIILREQSRSW